MTAGIAIVAVCALGALIACGAFWWATRSGEFADASEAQYLVFDEEDGEVLASLGASSPPAPGPRPAQRPAPAPPQPPAPAPAPARPGPGGEPS